MDWNRLRREALAKARTESPQQRQPSRWLAAGDRILELWRRAGALSWLEKGIIAAAGTLVVIATPVAVIALTGGGDAQQPQVVAPVPTAAARIQESSPTATAVPVVAELTATPAVVQAAPTVTDIEPSPTSPPPNRRDCEEIRGSSYLSATERDWFLANCLGSDAPPTAPATSTPPQPGEPPAPPPLQTPVPTATPASTLSSMEVIFLAAGWMADQAPLGYTVSAGSCSANRTAGLQWVVTCQAILEGCQGGGCQITLTACLIEDPLTIWSC